MYKAHSVCQPAIRSVVLLLAFSLIPALLFAQKQGSKYTVTETVAAAVVAAVLQQSPVIDGHNDLFVQYMDCNKCPRDIGDYPIDTISRGQTDIPRLRKGGAGAVLMNVFGKERSQSSYLQAWDLLYRLEEAYKNDIAIVNSSSGLRETMKKGRIAFLPTLEGAIRLEDNPALLRMYYRMGLRSVTFAYKTNGLADASDDTVAHNGISSKGRTMISEMNKLGVMIDLSHVSAKAMSDILDASKAPVFFSHSNAKALCNVNRNVPDDILFRLKKNGGLIMLTFVPYFTTNTFNEWMNSGDLVYYKALADFPNRRDTVNSIMEKWENDHPQPPVSVADLADHFDYVKKLIGIDHVGMAGDFDGISFTIPGLEDVSTYPVLLQELARRGWTVEELRKLTSENFLRVFEEVEKTALKIKSGR